VADLLLGSVSPRRVNRLGQDGATVQADGDGHERRAALRFHHPHPATSVGPFITLSYNRVT